MMLTSYAKVAALVLGCTAGFACVKAMLETNDMQQATSASRDPFAGLHREKSPERKDKLVLSDEEWKRRLTPEQYKILRREATEPAFCGVFHDTKKVGTYHCAGCDLPLFKSDTKFDSGTGWPSFFQPVNAENVWLRTDSGFGMVRQEVLCARCDGHLGHVFEDGPRPTNLRFCINSGALRFEEQK